MVAGLLALALAIAVVVLRVVVAAQQPPEASLS
jgi:hypothetical protein